MTIFFSSSCSLPQKTYAICLHLCYLSWYTFRDLSQIMLISGLPSSPIGSLARYYLCENANHHILMQADKENNLDYLFVINQYNEPLLFKSYRSSADDLNIQLHSYASLDFLDEKLMEKSSEYLGQVYTIFNLSGEYSIYAFYTVTRMKFLAIFKQRVVEKLDDDKVKAFFLKLYKLYRKQLYQPFENSLQQNKFSKKFHLILDTLAKSYVFK